jgi:hypothetical protein
MATRLTKPVEREITLTDDLGRCGPVVLKLTGRGLELRAKGKQRKLFVSYRRLKPDLLPGSIPAKYASNPLGWLVE